METNFTIDFERIMEMSKQSEFNLFMKLNFKLSKTPLIYGIHNKLNTEKWYIDQSKDLYQRLWNTRNRDGHCQKVHDKTGFIYENGVSNFELVILNVCNESELDDLEEYYCKKYKSYEFGYNKSIDGKGRWQKGLRYLINPITREEIRIPKDKPIPEGFIDGVSTLGRECYYNPSTGEMIKLLPGSEIPSGYIKGNVIKGRKVYINKSTGKVIRLSPDEEIPEGFEIGNNTTGKIRVYSIIMKKRYSLSVSEIKESEIPDLRMGCPHGEFWNDDKWKLVDIIDKDEI